MGPPQGLQGVVRIPDRPGDWVFFVTYGREVGHHKFDENLSEDGVLTWQSQPNQSFNDKRVMEWINHDHLSNSINLFLRPNEKAEYTFLGRLKYLRHDPNLEKPVYFQWQLMDWESLSGGLASLQIPASKPFLLDEASFLVEVSPPQISKTSHEKVREFIARKADFDERDRRKQHAPKKACIIMILCNISNTRRGSLLRTCSNTHILTSDINRFMHYQPPDD